VRSKDLVKDTPGCLFLMEGWWVIRMGVEMATEEVSLRVGE